MASNAALNGCVSTLAQSLSMLSSSLDALNHSTSDFPRVSTILSNIRVFELVPDSHISNAQADLAKEIEPQITQLLSRAEVELAKLERKRVALSSKADLLQVRLDETQSQSQLRQKSLPTDEQRERLKYLKMKRERLEYSLSNLNLKVSYLYSWS